MRAAPKTSRPSSVNVVCSLTLNIRSPSSSNRGRRANPPCWTHLAPGGGPGRTPTTSFSSRSQLWNAANRLRLSADMPSP
jgi:hypothetical protein